MLARLKSWARVLRRDVIAIWLASRDPRVPLLPKVLAALVAAYALSPIDLIPDVIPVLGYLDELILLPLAIAVIVRMIDPVLMAEYRATAERMSARPVSRTAAAVIVALWLIAGALAAFFLWRWFSFS